MLLSLSGSCLEVMRSDHVHVTLWFYLLCLLFMYMKGGLGRRDEIR